MKQYDWIIFDADDTLFHFDAKSGLKKMFEEYDVDFSDEDYVIYQKENLILWDQYQNGFISAEKLKHQRFDLWSARLGVPSKELNQSFLFKMADVSLPLSGAKEMLIQAKKNSKLGIITNGFSDLQVLRLNRTGLQPFFDFLIVSEEVGAAKPDTLIFETAFRKMNHPPLENVLMVGDNPHTDILGGMNFGFHTCWFNPNQKETPIGIQPTFQVRNHDELSKHLGLNR